MYVKVVDNEVSVFPYTIDALKADNPQTSFPDTISDAVLAGYGVYRVTKVDPPNHNPKLERLTLSNPALVDGQWTQTWSQANRSSEEAALEMRNDRNQLLADTDHYALSDNTLSTEMATYRQALRDVPSQSGFPFNVTWPTKP